MTITLYLEVAGKIKDETKCDYMLKEKIAAAWYRMYPGKRIKVYYILESKINYEQDSERNTGRDH